MENIIYFFTFIDILIKLNNMYISHLDIIINVSKISTRYITLNGLIKAIYAIFCWYHIC